MSLSPPSRRGRSGLKVCSLLLCLRPLTKTSPLLLPLLGPKHQDTQQCRLWRPAPRLPTLCPRPLAPPGILAVPLAACRLGAGAPPLIREEIEAPAEIPPQKEIKVPVQPAPPTGSRPLHRIAARAETGIDGIEVLSEIAPPQVPRPVMLALACLCHQSPAQSCPHHLVTGSHATIATGKVIKGMLAPTENCPCLPAPNLRCAFVATVRVIRQMHAPPRPPQIGGRGTLVHP